MGLAMVREFVRLHGGSVTVGEAPGGGSLFTVELPLLASAGSKVRRAVEVGDEESRRAAVEELRTRATHRLHAERRPEVKAPLVLVVEDNLDMSAFLSEALSRNYRVTTAFDGQEGLDKAFALRPDLILCDVMMPHMSGDQMVGELRGQREFDDTPIVLLTAKADDELRVRLITGGVQDYLAKPFSPEEMLAKVERLIADRKRAAEELRKWKHIFDHAGFGMAIIDPANHTLKAVNPAFAQMHGYSVQELVGKSRPDLCAPGPRAEFDEHMRMVDENGHHIYESVQTRKDGTPFPVLIDATAFRDAEGKLQYRAAYFQDMTAHKRIEEALRSTEKLASIGRLAAAIAHEINNPLETLFSTIALLQEQSRFDEGTCSYLKIAQQELLRIAEITKNTMNFYRESATPVLVRISDVLDSVLELYARKIRFDDIKVERRYDFKDEIQTFPGEMRQVFANLVRNALEAVHQGGIITLHVFASRDWTKPDRRGVRVTIADCGKGIRPDHLSRIFEPFFTTKGEKGTGIGLWVTSGIVHKHGGSIHVRSSVRPEHTGSCFSVFLPRETPAAQHQPAHATAAHGAAAV